MKITGLTVELDNGACVEFENLEILGRGILVRSEDVDISSQELEPARNVAKFIFNSTF